MLVIFWNRVSQTICPGWFWTTILLITASWVVRITGVSTGAQHIMGMLKQTRSVVQGEREDEQMDLRALLGQQHSNVSHMSLSLFSKSKGRRTPRASPWNPWTPGESGVLV
jgi:hypothetical protein